MSKEYKVFLSPSNQFANRYAAGNTNEGKQMGLVANLLKAALERCGIKVMLMHDQSMSEKVQTADNWGADLYISIHSDACNGEVAGTRMFCWSKPGKGYNACFSIFKHLAPLTPGESESIKVDKTLYEVRYPAAPVAYIEVDFHDVAEVAEWIITHTAEIAEAICKGVCDYFGVAYKAPALPTSTISVPILRTQNDGQIVKTLQTLLNYRGRVYIDVDGDFGPATLGAVKAYQQSKGLEVDGIVGKATWEALLK